MTNIIQLLQESGWTLVEHIDLDPIPVEKLEILEFVKANEDFVPWDLMRERAKDKSAVYAQNQAEFLLQNQDKIPESWRTSNIVFPGTIWKSVTGHLHCPILEWKNNKWNLGFNWFLYEFYKEDKLITLKQLT